MGGQFPLEKVADAFKNPNVLHGCRGANRPKKELSVLMSKNPVFYADFPEKLRIYDDLRFA